MSRKQKWVTHADPMSRKQKWVTHAEVTLDSDARGVLLQAPTGEEGWLPEAIVLEVLDDPAAFAERVGRAVAGEPVPFVLVEPSHA